MGTATRPVGASVEQGADAIRTAVGSCMDTSQCAAIDLSGGMDSRMILAAVPQRRRGGMTAFTVGDPRTEEVAIARRVAHATGLRHVIVDTTPIDRLGVDEATGLMAAASLRQDHSGNAFAAASLLWSERQLEQCSRFTGQNGEFARDF